MLKYGESALLKENKLEEIKPETITHYAKEFKDPLAIDAIKWLFESIAKLVSDMTLLHIPYGGIYLTASVI